MSTFYLQGLYAAIGCNRGRMPIGSFRPTSRPGRLRRLFHRIEDIHRAARCVCLKHEIKERHMGTTTHSHQIRYAALSGRGMG